MTPQAKRLKVAYKDNIKAQKLIVCDSPLLYINQTLILPRWQRSQQQQ